MEKQKQIVQITINLPMEFPNDWSRKDIEFYLNESSWCNDNYIELLEEYSEKHGCLCHICSAKILQSE